MEIPKFENKKALFDFLVENKGTLIAQKKGAPKHADGFAYFNTSISKSDGVEKVNVAISNPPDTLSIKAVINTTNVMDSHKDVHIPGLWKKSLRENKNIMHLQEHQMSFDKIISEGSNLKAYTESFTWKELGFKMQGSTEALVFNSDVEKVRNPYMHNQYSKGYVKNHSVGMQYVKIDMAINDEDYKEEFATWNKYIDQVANREEAEKTGYFWPVTEAKIIEGSAVPIGSNQFTPTLENNMEPDKSTPKEPLEALEINKFRILIKNVLS